MFRGIDLYSDTMTRPTPAMRRAMAEAEVGDEQEGEDPTTARLEARAAELLGHSAAMFFPSATMANQIALRLHCEPGDELIADSGCHLFFAEAGGPAVHSGVMARGIPTANGVFTGEDVRRTYRAAKGPHYPISKIVSVENTTNMGGGIAWPEETLRSVVQTARELGLKLHMDGSRLFNAVVKQGTTAKAIASRFDTVTVCFSKGLGCPTGAVLAYDQANFPRVRRLKQLMGGAMRQSGILAAAALHALDHHVERLAEDHENAQRLAARLADGIPHVTVENHPPSTNMVFFHWTHPSVNASEFSARCKAQGLRFSRGGESRFRAVTHLDVQRADIDKAVDIVRTIAREA